MMIERLLFQISRVTDWLAHSDDRNWARQTRFLTYLESVDCRGSINEARAYVTRCELICSWPIRAFRRRVKKADMANYRFVRRAFNPRESDWW